MYCTRRLLTYELGQDRYLLINTLSGALDILDGNTWGALSRLDTDEPLSGNGLTTEVETRLRRRLYLFDTTEAEAQCLQDLIEVTRQRRNNEPVQFVVCPTYACNLGCSYCFEGDIARGPMKVMSQEQVDDAFQAIDAILAQFYPSARGHVVLFGGEPLLRPTRDCVQAILAQAAVRESSVDVVTNGVQATDFLDLFEAHKAAIEQIQITLDGPAEVHDRRRMHRNGAGTFDAIVEAVDQLLERQLPVTIRVNVDDENLASLPALIEFMESRGWTLYPHFATYIFPVTTYGDSERGGLLHEDRLLYELQCMFQGERNTLPSFALYGFKVLGHVASVIDPASLRLRMPPLLTYCEANGLRYFAFGPDGYIYPCGQSVGRVDMAIGRFSPNLELWPAQCDEWRTRSVMTIPKCRECPIATLCGGGCAYAAYRRTGSVLTPNCQHSQATLDAYLERMKPHIAQKYCLEQ